MGCDDGMTGSDQLLIYQELIDILCGTSQPFASDVVAADGHKDVFPSSASTSATSHPHVPASVYHRLSRLLETWAIEGRDSWAPLCRRLAHRLPDRCGARGLTEALNDFAPAMLDLEYLDP